MLLYHGSNMVVREPRILPNLRQLDFGGGFYLTSSKQQATKWAHAVTRRRNRGKAVLNTYKLDISNTDALNVLKFPEANGGWLDFVVANRRGTDVDTSYDLVIGPVANDSTLPVIDDYMRGTYPKHIAIELLQPQNLTDQYAFLSEKALSLLTFVEGKTL